MIRKPRSLKGPAADVWAEIVRPAKWLRPKDLPDAIAFCQMAAAMEARDFAIDKWGHLRAIRRFRTLGRRLGFDPLSRARRLEAMPSGPAPLPPNIARFFK